MASARDGQETRSVTASVPANDSLVTPTSKPASLPEYSSLLDPELTFNTENWLFSICVSSDSKKIGVLLEGISSANHQFVRKNYFLHYDGTIFSTHCFNLSEGNFIEDTYYTSSRISYRNAMQVIKRIADESDVVSSLHSYDHYLADKVSANLALSFFAVNSYQNVFKVEKTLFNWSLKHFREAQIDAGVATPLSLDLTIQQFQIESKYIGTLEVEEAEQSDEEEKSDEAGQEDDPAPSVKLS